MHALHLRMCHCESTHIHVLGLFTLLLQDFGVKDTEVVEVYDLSKPIDWYVALANLIFAIVFFSCVFVLVKKIARLL